MSNYRPIALLPSISKIFEKVILLQLTKYLDENNYYKFARSITVFGKIVLQNKQLCILSTF